MEQPKIMTSANLKQKILKTVEEMPQDVSFEEVMERLYFLYQKNQDDLLWNQEEQLQKNQPALERLKKRMERHQQMSDGEAEARTKFFADFKSILNEGVCCHF
jgi:uncharacterized protein YjcR